MKTKAAKPWEFYEGTDTKKSFPIFAKYRDSPAPRPTLAEMAAELGVPESTLGTWSTDGMWQARVQAYDEHLAKRTARAAETEADRMGKALARGARVGHAFALRQIERYAAYEKKCEEDGIPIPDQTLRDMARLLHMTFQQTRTILGQPSKIVENKVADLGALSDEEFEAYEELQAKMRAGKPKE